MKKTIFILIALLCSVNIFADNYPIAKRKGRAKAVKKIMMSMTEKQMIGQMFMIDSYSVYDTLQIKKVFRQIDSNCVGGVCFFKGNQKDLVRMNKAYNRRSKIPLFTAIDAEYGLGMRMTDGTVIPMAMTMGALPENEYYLVNEIAKNEARQCKSLGININFAPDADININPDNPVINMRSFGQDKTKVAHLAKEYFSGLQSLNVMATVKHFPGHGDTKTDSHKATPVITHDKNFIDSLDSYPFRYAVDNKVWGVMAGHLEIASLTKNPNIPSSVNEDIINGYLNDDLGFEGLVFTDAMNMKGLTDRYGKGEAEVLAVLAGVDIILMPENTDTAISAVIRAVNEGRIPRKLIKEKCRKILLWKYDMGLFDNNCEFKVPDSKITDQSDTLSYKIYRSAVTSVMKNSDATGLEAYNDTVVLLAVGPTQYNTLVNGLNEKIPVVFKRITAEMKAKECDSVLASLPKDKRIYTLVAGGKFAKSSSYYGVPTGTFPVLKKICNAVENNNYMVLFGNAYLLKYIDTAFRFDDILVAYENNTLSQRAVAHVLLDNQIPRGVLPVTARKEHVIIEQQPEETANESGYELFADQGVDTNVLKSIDSIAQEGIKQHAYPGCQILIAKDNKIIFDKNYGYHTYDSLIPVADNTVYDIASLTKVMATTLAVMKLTQTGKIHLDDPIKKYVPEYKHVKFGKLTVRELLSHYTTLPATYLFWTKTLKDGKLDMDVYDYNVRMDENYIPVTDSLFIKKSHLATMRKQLKDVKLKDQQYTYSDLNFLLLQYMVENVSGKSLDKYMEDEFYNKMGLHNTCFNPLDKGVSKENIAPTEYDTVFRHQLIHGTVHDPMASLHGGVCGNAGVFSDAHDIYKICSMLLNNGEFDGVRYLDSTTIAMFNHRWYQDKNIRRALGFDKPFISSVSTHCSKYAPQSSYGHSGFTGTYFWVDPDNKTVFIFLSNRVQPYATPNKLASMNIRTDINDLIYKLFK